MGFHSCKFLFCLWLDWINLVTITNLCETKTGHGKVKGMKKGTMGVPVPTEVSREGCLPICHMAPLYPSTERKRTQQLWVRVTQNRKEASVAKGNSQFFLSHQIQLFFLICAVVVLLYISDMCVKNHFITKYNNNCGHSVVASSSA